MIIALLLRRFHDDTDYAKVWNNQLSRFYYAQFKIRLRKNLISPTFVIELLMPTPCDDVNNESRAILKSFFDIVQRFYDKGSSNAMYQIKKRTTNHFVVVTFGVFFYRDNLHGS